MSEEKKFIQGLWFNLPHEKAPDFVKGSVSLSKESFLKWLQEEVPNEKGYIKIDLKVSKQGKAYAEVNDYQPEQKNNDDVNVDEVPFA